MTTTKLSSNKGGFKAAFKHALKLGMPFGVIISIAAFLSILLPYYFYSRPFMESRVDYMYSSLYYSPQELANSLEGVFLAIEQSVSINVMFGAIAFVLALFYASYLHSKPKTDFYHSLPVKRTHLLNANAIAAMIVLLVPYLAIILITMLLQFVQVGAYINLSDYFFTTIMEVLNHCLLMLVVYLFVTFISVNLGTIFDSAIISVSMGFIPLTTVAVLLALWSNYIYGADVSYRFLPYLSPYIYSFNRVGFFDYYNQTTSYLKPFVVGIIYAVAFYLLGVYSYKVRKSETAEQKDSSSWPQTITKCFVSFISATGFFFIFEYYGLVIQIIAAIIGGTLIGIIAEIILSRGIRSIVKNLKWLAGAGALFCLIIIVLQFDITGFSKKLPLPANVASVSLSYNGRYADLEEYNYYGQGSDDKIYKDPENIATILESHKLIVENQPESNHARFSYYNDESDNFVYESVSISYKLKTGRTLKRTYNYLNNDGFENLANLEGTEEFVRNNSLLFRLDYYTKNSGKTEEELLYNVAFFDNLANNRQVLNLSTQEKGLLLVALKKDMLNETTQNIKNPTQPAVGVINLMFDISTKDNNYYGNIYRNTNVVITNEYTNTIAFLNSTSYAGLVGKPPQQFDKAVIESFYSPSRVVSIVSENYYNEYYRDYYSDDYNDSYTVKTENQSDIEALQKSAKIQRMVTKDETDAVNLFKVTFIYKDNLVGSGIIERKDIPASLAKEADRKFNNEVIEENYGYAA